jgi:RimJ/RimL family protein N-acetyltransferase
MHCGNGTGVCPSPCPGYGDGVLDRVARGLRRHGVVGSARIGAAKLRPDPPYEAALIWYALDLASARPRRELGPGLELRRATEADVAMLEQLPRDPAVIPVDRDRALRRLREGAELWLVAEAERLAFACWIFRGETPVYGARGGVLSLPDGVVCLEDSHASPAFRGRGIAPGAWSGIADACAASGAGTMVTKVRVENAASRRAVEKAGFAAVAEMHVQRRGWRSRISVRPSPGAGGEWLRSLERGR